MHGDVWFFAPPERWGDETVTLDPAESHHAIRVLRARPPDVITISDGNGLVARCSIVRTEEDGVVAEILETSRMPTPVPQVAVYQGAAKGHKNDEVVERLAELGVSDLTVFDSRRAVVQWDESKKRKLHDRWSSIAASAAKQSKNAYAMKTLHVIDWPALVEAVRHEPLAVVLWEGAELPLRTAFVHGARRVALVVGPEGGLERAEAEELADAGAQLVSLGTHIYRTENAAAFAGAAVMYHYGTLG